MAEGMLFDLPPAIKKRRKGVPLDLIYCGYANFFSLIAKDCGWLIGVRSSNYRERSHKWAPPEEVRFVDNEFEDYDHAVHVAVVKECQPKYATVRDLMTPEQCAAAGIAHYSFDEVMDMAKELSAYAERVIIIPKYDVLDDIPKEFVLGYSVPSSYGRTPLPIERFAGRDIHLLGGSWETQRSYLAKLGDDVVSCDLNYTLKVANYGQVVMPDGELRQLSEMGIFVRNKLVVAFAMSLGHIATEVEHIWHRAEMLGGKEQDGDS